MESRFQPVTRWFSTPHEKIPKSLHLPPRPPAEAGTPNPERSPELFKWILACSGI
jgi:hypothetical protein